MENQTTPTPVGYPVRFTSKVAKHPVTGATLRDGFEAFTLRLRLPLSLGNKIGDELVARQVKEMVQLADRARWIAGEKPYNPEASAEVQSYFREEFEKVTESQLASYLFDPITRGSGGGFGAKAWEQWLASQFLPALDAFYKERGEPGLDGRKRVATIALLKQGRNMAGHNKESFNARFASMLESNSEAVLEVVTSEESRKAMEWLIAEAKATELEI
jgi:hypothetical protein